MSKPGSVTLQRFAKYGNSQLMGRYHAKTLCNIALRQASGNSHSAWLSMAVCKACESGVRLCP
ncbi:hypothetical protein SBA3_3470005 [Candidatus Sulfopaludibacter sp. SbA3]|nr:hypothetical protein SBA3_3470005 [Candidatus Sulfopaludibacter sp. SbA3]